MAVYRKTYRPYEGALTPSWSRLFVIPRYAFEELRRSRFISLFYVATFIYPLICARLIYVAHNDKADRFLLHDRDKGAMGQTLADITSRALMVVAMTVA